MMRPILKVTRVRQGTLYEGEYLSVIIKGGGKQKTLKSFGNVNDPDNWDEAITFILDLQMKWYREFYEEKKAKYTGG